MTPEEALNKIVGRLSDWNYHNLLEEIHIVKQAIQKRKKKQSNPNDLGVLSDDY